MLASVNVPTPGGGRHAATALRTTPKEGHQYKDGAVLV
jgi:hypothetical protein